jgi:DNA polymerase-1
MSNRHLVLVDGYSLLYRAFFGQRFLSTTDGRPTNALFGFLSMVFRVLEKDTPASILIALDAPGKTFRHAEYAEYKGTRREMPEEMKVQIPIAREMIRALGIPQIELVGYEADDIIGTLSLQAEQHGYRTTIITGDLDALQLVDSMVTVMVPKVGVTDVTLYDPEAVFARYGFGPDQVKDYKALAGDSSDNIPGVPGIGEKSATALLQKFENVEGILARFDEVEEKFKKKIEPVIDTMEKWKKLCTIDRHAPIEWDFKPYEVTPELVESGTKFLENLEFRNFVKKLPAILSPYMAGGGPRIPVVEVVEAKLEPREIGTAKDLGALRAWIADRPFSIVGPLADQASMFEDAGNSGMATLAVGLETMAAPKELALDMFREAAHNVVVHDAKPWFTKAPEVQSPVRMDTMLAGYVLQSGRSQYALRDIAQGYLEVLPPTTAAEQAVALTQLDLVLSERLGKEGQTSVLVGMEQPLTPLLAQMEARGIALDASKLQEFSRELEAEIGITQEKVYELAGGPFVIGSPKQLGEVLFEKLGIPGAKKTKTGYATGAEVLEPMREQYPIAAEVLRFRELTKLKSTYADSLPRLLASDGRIHTAFHQTVAATGRLSSQDPNLQNIPIRTALGRKIREAFVAAPGFKLLSLDYSQIELRLLAHMCEDSVLVKAFQDRVDVHTVTASLMFHVEQGDVTKSQRRLAKMLNYAVLYGVSEYGLAQQLGGEFSISESKELIKQYFERFPTVKEFTESVIAGAKSTGFTTTLAHRRRYFPEIHAANRNERMSAERQAVNAPIQGTAADMIKLAMIQLTPVLAGRKSRMLLQVHDELLFELAEGEEELIEPIRTTMEDALPLKVPVEVDAKVGENWNDMVVC